MCEPQGDRSLRCPKNSLLLKEKVPRNEADEVQHGSMWASPPTKEPPLIVRGGGFYLQNSEGIILLHNLCLFNSGVNYRYSGGGD